MIGHYHLPRILHDLSAHLEYHWTIASIIGGGRQSFIPNRLVHVAYKLILWFQKGRYRGKAVRDIIQSGKQDKRFHLHGQSEDEFLHLIQRFTKMGDTVLDPFVGGGSVASAAMKLKREFIGIDKDRRSIEATRRRIELVTARLY